MGKVNKEAKAIKSQIEAQDHKFDHQFTRLRNYTDIGNDYIDEYFGISMYCIGEKVFVYDAGLLYNATIMEAEEKDLNFYRVHYLGSKKIKDEWIPLKRILKRTRTSTIIKNKLKDCKVEGKPINLELDADDIRTTNFYTYITLDETRVNCKNNNESCNRNNAYSSQVTSIKNFQQCQRNIYSNTHSTPRISEINSALNETDHNNNILRSHKEAKGSENSSQNWQDKEKELVSSQNFQSWMK